MKDPVYKLIELTGTSTALPNCRRSCRNATPDSVCQEGLVSNQDMFGAGLYPMAGFVSVAYPTETRRWRERFAVMLAAK
jgi:hypothetical protein